MPSGPNAQIALRVRPGSSRDLLKWDPWRHRWIVACRAPAIEGRANRAVLQLVAAWLEVPSGAVRWARAGRSPDKEIRVEGMDDAEAVRRLRAHQEDDRGPAVSAEPR